MPGVFFIRNYQWNIPFKVQLQHSQVCQYGTVQMYSRYKSYGMYNMYSMCNMYSMNSMYNMYVSTYVRLYPVPSNHYLVSNTWCLVPRMHPYTSGCIRMHSHASTTHPYAPIRLHRPHLRIPTPMSHTPFRRKGKESKNDKTQNSNCDR